MAINKQKALYICLCALHELVCIVLIEASNNKHKLPSNGLFYSYFLQQAMVDMVNLAFNFYLNLNVKTK